MYVKILGILLESIREFIVEGQYESELPSRRFSPCLYPALKFAHFCVILM